MKLEEYDLIDDAILRTQISTIPFMNTYPVKRGRLVQSIQAGIASRGFHIVSNLEDLPNCQGSKSEKLEQIHRFAEENGWQVKIHNGNGWILIHHGRRSAS